MVFCIVGTIFKVIRNIRRTMEDTFNMKMSAETMEHTLDFIQELKTQQQEYELKPRSVSSMTSVYLPQITRDFPEFNLFEFKTKAENALMSALKAISRCDKNAEIEMASDDLIHKIAHIIDNAKASGEYPHYENIKIHQTEINKYIKVGGTCRIVFESSLEYITYTETSGVIKNGSMTQKRQTKYTTELVYVQDASKTQNASNGGVGVTCPNCGAPITSLGQKRCNYCLSAITEINMHTWSFNDFDEVRTIQYK